MRRIYAFHLRRGGTRRFWMRVCIPPQERWNEEKYLHFKSVLTVYMHSTSGEVERGIYTFHLKKVEPRGLIIE
jgi:hypothetical protein